MGSVQTPEIGFGTSGPTITLRVVQHPIVFGVIRTVDTILHPIVVGK